jgi:hypothetical protein
MSTTWLLLVGRAGQDCFPPTQARWTACALPACLPLPLLLLLLLHLKQHAAPAQVARGDLECPDCLCAAGPAAVSEQTAMETQAAGC